MSTRRSPVGPSVVVHSPSSMVRVVPALATIVTLGVLAFDDVLVVERDERLDAPMADLARQIAASADAENDREGARDVPAAGHRSHEDGDRPLKHC